MDTFIASSSVRRHPRRAASTRTSRARSGRSTTTCGPKLIIQYWPDGRRGRDRRAREGPSVAFNIARFNGSSTDTLIIASYNVVMSLDGDDITIRRRCARTSNHEVDRGRRRLGALAACCAAPRRSCSPATTARSRRGPAFLWNWKTDTYNQLAAGTRTQLPRHPVVDQEPGRGRLDLGPDADGEPHRRDQRDDGRDDEEHRDRRLHRREPRAARRARRDRRWRCRKTNSFLKIHIEDCTRSGRSAAPTATSTCTTSRATSTRRATSLVARPAQRRVLRPNPTESDGGDASPRSSCSTTSTSRATRAACSS